VKYLPAFDESSAGIVVEITKLVMTLMLCGDDALTWRAKKLTQVGKMSIARSGAQKNYK